MLNDNSISLKGVPLKKMKVLEKGPSQTMLKNAAQLCFLQLVHIKQVFDQHIEIIDESADVQN